MTKAQLAEIERYLETDHEGSFSHGALAEAVGALRERDTQIAKLRAACEQALIYGSFHPARTVLAQALKETES